MELEIKYEVQELKTNFKDVKASVELEIKKHSIDVVEENIQEAKKVMANLNKVKGEIASKYKKYIDTISTPIQQLKSEEKELEEIITQGRQKIADAVRVFEEKRLNIVEDVLLRYLIHSCTKCRINHASIQIKDLVKLTAVTASGKIAKATAEIIDSRISLVEKELLKARLEEEEKRKRDAEIAEKARLEAEDRAREREVRIRAEAEENKRKALEQAELNKQKEIEKAKIEAMKEAKNAELHENQTIIEKVPPKKYGDKIVYTVLATFEVPVPSHITPQQVENAVRKKLINDAGVTTLQKIEVM